uniref:Putative secreted salivary protein n=1 Tax=Culicoides sonorensis TaxID=179676 RepID=Q66U77_CULSO|nr:putative secreted salivary protein [Culicoides sonorensis]
MKLLLVFLTFFISIIFGITSAYNLPNEQYFNTTKLWSIRKCERDLKLNDAERQIWWPWKVPDHPTKCFAQCVFKSVGWVQDDGWRINFSQLHHSYRLMGHRILPTYKIMLKRCRKSPTRDNCEEYTLRWKCLLQLNERAFMDSLQWRIAIKF